MPAIRLFGRRCSVATDDFLFIGIIDCIFFLPWLGCIPVIYAHYLNQRNNCDGVCAYLLDVSLPGLCLFFLFNWLIGCLYIIFSLKGTISQPKPRRHVVTLVYLKFVLSVIELAWTALGVVIMYWECYCEMYSVEIAIKVVTIFQLLLAVIRLGKIVLLFDCFCASKKKSQNVVEREYIAATATRDVIRRWNLRFQALFLWCTTPSQARKEAIQTTSELMAFLSSDLDLVPSDVIAGFLIYRRRCFEKWEAEKKALDAAPPILLSDGSSTDHFPPAHLPAWMNLKLAHRYFDLGMGVFGWPWFIYRNLACGCCLLCKRLTCCFPFRKRGSKVWGDNCCGCNLAGLESTTGLPYEDLVYVSFVNRVFETPFYVTFDHETSTVLVTIRGSMSMNDVLTDVAAAYAPMDDPECPTGALCHGGMLKAAREIKRKIEEKHLLENAFKAYPDYQLVLTGHSLGASVASILTLLLRGSYPNVRCFAFAPAPALNRTALLETFDSVFTVVYGNDCVVYLNYENIHGLIKEMAKCLEECDLPKYKVFMKPKENDKDSESKPSSNGDIEKAASEIPAAKEQRNNEGSNGVNVEEVPNGQPCVSESLYVAGTILHIWPAFNGYRLRLTTADYYQPLVFRPNMVYFHFPQCIQACLKKLGEMPTLEPSSVISSEER